MLSGGRLIGQNSEKKREKKGPGLVGGGGEAIISRLHSFCRCLSETPDRHFSRRLGHHLNSRQNGPRFSIQDINVNTGPGGGEERNEHVIYYLRVFIYFLK